MEQVEKRGFSTQKVLSWNHQATRARRGCLGLFLLTVSLVCFCWASPVDAGWKRQNPLSLDKGFAGGWGSSGTDVFVVGDHGTIHHNDGTKWREDMSPLSGVWGSSGTDVFAVGDDGIILHYQ